VDTFFIIAPVVVGIIALAGTIASSLFRVWVRHRLKMALLEKLQHDPNHPETLGELARLALPAPEAGPDAPWVDHRIMGGALAAMGLLSVLVAWLVADPAWMTGVYVGGVVCVAVGAILALLGLVVRHIEKLPAGLPHQE